MKVYSYILPAKLLFSVTEIVYLYSGVDIDSAYLLKNPSSHKLRNSPHAHTAVYGEARRGGTSVASASMCLVFLGF